MFLFSHLCYTYISMVESHIIVYQEFTDQNTFITLHDWLSHRRSIIMLKIVEISHKHLLKNLLLYLYYNCLLVWNQIVFLLGFLRCMIYVLITPLQCTKISLQRMLGIYLGISLLSLLNIMNH